MVVVPVPVPVVGVERAASDTRWDRTPRSSDCLGLGAHPFSEWVVLFGDSCPRRWTVGPVWYHVLLGGEETSKLLGISINHCVMLCYKAKSHSFSCLRKPVILDLTAASQYVSISSVDRAKEDTWYSRQASACASLSFFHYHTYHTQLYYHLG